MTQLVKGLNWAERWCSCSCSWRPWEEGEDRDLDTNLFIFSQWLPCWLWALSKVDQRSTGHYPCSGNPAERTAAYLTWYWSAWCNWCFCHDQAVKSAFIILIFVSHMACLSMCTMYFSSLQVSECTHLFLTRVWVLFFFKVKIRLRTPISTLLGQGQIRCHSTPRRLNSILIRVACRLISLIGSHARRGQHSQPTLTALGQGCMHSRFKNLLCKP